MEQVYKRNDFIVKFFACLFFAVFLLFTFIGSRVFASTEDGHLELSDCPDVNSLVGDKYWFVFSSKESGYYRETLFISEYPFIIYEESGDSRKFIKNSNNSEILEYLYQNNSDFKWQYNYNSSSYVIYMNDKYLINNYDGNCDLVNENGNVVFQAPPQEQDKVLAPIVEGEEMKPLQEILQILPIVMIVVVGYLALRKGLATLFRFLRTS